MVGMLQYAVSSMEIKYSSDLKVSEMPLTTMAKNLEKYDFILCKFACPARDFPPSWMAR